MHSKPQNFADEHAMYRRLLDGLGDGHCVFSHSAEGVFQYASPGFKALFGVENKDIIGKDWRSLKLTEESLIAGELADQKILTEKTPQTVELTAIHKDGSTRIIEICYSPVFEGEKVVMMDGICSDITERKKLEERLESSKRHFKELIKHSSDALVLLDADGTQIFVSDAGLKMTGYTVAEVTNIEVIDTMIHPDDREKVRACFMKILEEGEAGVQYRYEHKEGHWIYLEGWGNNQLENPDIGAIIINVRDISKRKKVELALQESENKFRNVIESSPMGMYLYELNPNTNDLTLTGTNPAADQILGISNKELIGKTIEEAFPGLTQTGIPDMYREVAMGVIGPQSFEIPYKDKNIDCFNSVNIYQAGINTIAVNFIDISERKKFEHELIQSKKKSEENEESFRKLFELSPDPILLLKEEKFVRCNQAAIRFLKVKDKNSVIGLSPDQISPEFQANGQASSELSPAYIKKAHEEGYFRFEWTHLRMDKTPFLLEVTLVPIVLKGEELLHVTWRDITESKRNEEALHKRIVALTQPLNQTENIDLEDLFNLEDLQKLQDDFAKATGVATQITKANGSPITKPCNSTRFCNDIIRKTEKGCEHCKKSDMTLSQISYAGPNLQTCIKAGLWNAGASITVGGKHIATWQIGQVRDESQSEEKVRAYAREIGTNEEEAIKAFYEIPSMSRKTFDQIAKMLFTLANQLSTLAFQNTQQARLIYGRGEDEKELLKLNEQLKLSSEALSASNIELKIAAKKAEESDRLKSAFLANMSHEIRTPMNAIIGFSSIMRETEAGSDQFNHYIDIITDSGEHLMRLIDDIIDISKIDAGEVSANPTAVNIQNLLEELQLLYTNQIESKNKENITLSFECSDTIPPTLTDKTRLKQILTNLLGNAIKFTADGSIHFGCKKEGNDLLFWVKDTGIGISKDHYELIFDRFKQASSDTETLYGGTGLGLSIAKACVELLEGKIWVESQETKGTTFYFKIPHKLCEQQKSPLQSIDISSIKLLGKRALIAEDDRLNFEYIAIILKSVGMEVVHAQTGKQVLEHYSNDNNFDIIIMDIQMPEMDGIAATNKIRETDSKIPVLALTAFALTEDKNRCIEAGCSEYLQKPILKDLLLNTIAKLLN